MSSCYQGPVLEPVGDKSKQEPDGKHGRKRILLCFRAFPVVAAVLPNLQESCQSRGARRGGNYVGRTTGAAEDLATGSREQWRR